MVDGVFPARQVARVLAQAAADMTQRADTQADDVAFGAGGVTEQVAAQFLLPVSQRQTVVGRRETAQADMHIAGSFDPLCEVFEPVRLHAGGCFFVAGLLAGFGQRRACLAAQAETIRAQRQHLCQQRIQFRRRLLEQAPAQVHMDIAQTVLAQVFDQPGQRRDVAVEVAVQIEHRAVEAGIDQRRNIRAPGRGRLQLQRAQGAGRSRPGIVPADHVHRLGQMFRVQMAQRVVQHVHLFDLAITVEQFGAHRDFPVQPGQIGIATGAAIGSGAQQRALREGDAQRQRARDRIAIGDRGDLAQLAFLEAGRHPRAGAEAQATGSRRIVTRQLDECGRGRCGGHAGTVVFARRLVLDLHQSGCRLRGVPVAVVVVCRWV